MARNYTLVHEYQAEYKAAPFARPVWTVGQWQSSERVSRAVGTVGRGLLVDGWRELTGSDLRRLFPHGASGGAPVSRAFVRSEGGSRHGHVVALTDQPRGELG